jgi:hypothetical protein
VLAKSRVLPIVPIRDILSSSKGNDEIKLHNNLHFQIVSTGPTPVSFATGPVAFAEGLRAVGYDPQPSPGRPDHLVFDYPVEVGRRAGEKVRLGLIVP